MVPPELHCWDLSHRSVLSTGFRLIPEEQIVDIKTHGKCTCSAPRPVPRPGHDQHQKLAEPHPLSPAASPQQQHTASHQRVAQQRADGHHVNQGFQVEKESQESCRGREALSASQQSWQDCCCAHRSRALPLPPWVPLTPTAAGLKHSMTWWCFGHWCKASCHLLPGSSERLELVSGTASRPNDLSPNSEEISLWARRYCSNSYWQARRSVLSC